MIHLVNSNRDSIVFQKYSLAIPDHIITENNAMLVRCTSAPSNWATPQRFVPGDTYRKIKLEDIEKYSSDIIYIVLFNASSELLSYFSISLDMTFFTLSNPILMVKLKVLPYYVPIHI